MSSAKSSNIMLKTVVVTVEGGVIQHIECPEGVSVVVRDYDIDATDVPHVLIDRNGNEYIEKVWLNQSILD